jgi:hypothetical protein
MDKGKTQMQAHVYELMVFAQMQAHYAETHLADKKQAALWRKVERKLRKVYQLMAKED